MAGLALADGGGPDYIDQLPDHLMHRIFSFLPTKDVVRFCSLSRRWLRCCTDVLNVDFHESLHTSRELHRFVSFVNGYIRRYSSDKMERFSLRLDRPCDRIQASIDPWIQFAVSHRVKELSLDLESYELPWFASSSTWLETLRITHCTIPNQCDGFNWFHLKELSISQMQLSDNMLRSIFLGTPALELLKLEGCRGLNTIDLRRPPRLRELVVDSNEGSRRLEIIAPSLRVLRLRGCWQCQELKLTDVSSVAEAELDFLLQVMVDRDDDFYIRPPQFFCNTFKGILDQLQQASVLRIGYWCNEVVSSMEEEAGVDIRKMTNVKHLMIDSMLDRVDLIGISALLERSPHVEKLELRRLGSDIDYEFDPRKRETHYTIPIDQHQRCLFPSGVLRSLEKYLKHVRTVILRWSDAATGQQTTRAFDPRNWSRGTCSISGTGAANLMLCERAHMDSDLRSQ